MSYKKWILIAILLFAAGLFLGFITPIGASLDEIAALGELAEILVPMPQSALFIVILINNMFALLISFALSPIFCLVPVLALVINGWVLAVVSALVIQGESIGFLLAGLLPHGVFEIPALILGQAAALSFGLMAVTALFRKEKRELLLPNLQQNLKYLMIAFLLLVPAAIIETYVTPMLLS
jgi:stage II sporulation protein M